jgi:hypothetical protein
MASVAALNRNERRRPLASAMTPVGISKRTIPAVNAAFAMKTSKMSSPASRRKRVLTPQMIEAERVNSPEMAR